MEADRRQQSVLRKLDWWTVLIYIALLSFGWISVCGASYSYGETDIFEYHAGHYCPFARR